MTRTKMRRLIGLVVFGVVAAWGLLGCAASQLTSGFTPVMSSSEHPASAIAVTLSPSRETVPSPTIDGPTPTPDAAEIDATLRAEYAAFATERAMMGVSVVPYETEAAYRTAGALDRTRQAELMYTPTPFGALPFPGTRLTDEELAERGWPRILDNGKRSEDCHTTAIWLDKAYVDAEIFSKYQALFELLAFRDGPPGEDFEARLGELMLPSEGDAGGIDEIVRDDIDNRDLGKCAYQGIAENVASLYEAGAYVSFPPDGYGRVLVWEWGNRVPLLEVLTDRAIAYQIGQDYFVVLDSKVVSPNGVVNSLSVDFQLRAVSDQRVLNSWNANWDPTRTDSNAVMVWRSDIGEWRAYMFASPYCDGFYPNTIRK